MTLLRRASLRFYLRHPWQLGLAITGISLGVGVYVSVSLANDSAARAFDVAAAEVRGAITHRLLPLDGSLDERSFASSWCATELCRPRPSSKARSASRVEPACACHCSGSSRSRQDGKLRVRAAAAG